MTDTLHAPLRIIALALGLGIAADVLFYERALGISAPLFVLLCLAVLLSSARTEARHMQPANLWLGMAALLFAGFLALRLEPTLRFFNALTCLGLLVLQIAMFRHQPLYQLGILQYGIRGIIATFEIWIRPIFLFANLGRNLNQHSDTLRKLLPMLRGLVLALPIALIFGGLLMSADSVFASYVDQYFDFDMTQIERIIPHIILISFVSWASIGAVLSAIVEEPQANMPSEGKTKPLPTTPPFVLSLGFGEALTVLLVINVLFGAFMLIQAAYLFGGLDTLSRTGMTYAEYARRGFFELVTVVCLALGLLWLLQAITARSTPRQERRFVWASAVMVVLLLGMIVSGFQRMWLYELAYGFTHLRLYTHSFMVWLGLVLLIFLLSLIRARPQHFVFGGLVSALLTLAILNAMNPDATIARANIERSIHSVDAQMAIAAGEYSYGRSYDIDGWYLSQLSPDATPTLIELLPKMSQEDQQLVRTKLEDQRQELEHIAADDGWPSWHFSSFRALEALKIQF